MATIITLAASQPAHAQAGALDTSFNTTGKATLNFGLGSSFVAAAVLQSDGKIVVVGSADGIDDEDFVVVRYNENGTLDTSFGLNGKATLDNFGGGDSGGVLAVQADGKIVVGGNVRDLDFNRDFGVARFNSDGTLDTSFGANGRVSSVGLNNANVDAIAVQPNGKIIITGGADFNGSINADAVLVRFNSNGTIDTSFDTDGIVRTTRFGADGEEFATGVVVQPDGKIVATVLLDSDGFALVRYNTDGSLDTTFDGDGKTTPDPDTDAVFGANPIIQPDGKIVVVGETDGDINFSDFSIFRFNTNGSLDSSFGNNGIATTDFGSSTELGVSDEGARALTIQPDGKIVVAGYTDPPNSDNDDFALARFNQNGSIDTSFGINGQVVTSVSDGDDEALSVVIQPGGNIVVVGDSDLNPNASGNGNENPRTNFALARYNSNGSLDSSFGTNGIVLSDPGSTEQANAVAFQSDGKVVVAGYAVVDFSPEIALARFNPNGTLDNSFGDGGKVAMEQEDFFNEAPNAVIIQPNGKIIVAGSRLVFTTDFTSLGFTIARYNPDGTLDTSFNRFGSVETDFGSGDDIAYSIAVQSDGKIIAAGRAVINGTPNFAVARYNVNGSLDTSFDTDGKLTTDFGADDQANAVAIQSDGKIVVAGQTNTGSARDVALARYNTNGALDTTFDTDGKATIDFAANADFATAIALQTDAKIVIAGNAATGADSTKYDFALARLNSNGTLDSSFNGAGRVLTDFGNHDNSCNAISIQSDGRIVTAGSAFVGVRADNRDFALARHNADGTPDNSFGADGKVLTDFGGSTDIAFGSGIQTDGNIVVVGSAIVGVTRDFAVARYLGSAAIPTLSIDDVTITEINGSTSNAVFTVKLSAASATGVTVNYATADGTATAPQDYTATSGTLTFAAGTLTQTIAVPIIRDRIDEATETFIVNLSLPTNATIGDAQAQGTIINSPRKGRRSIRPRLNQP